jgi:lysophospholipase L1-like esterase
MMKRFDRNLSRPLFAALVAVAFLATLHGQAPASNAHRIAVFGSSVANGTGDELGKEGYTGRLRAMLVSRGWEVLNQSRGGDNTLTMAPRFAPEGSPAPNTRYLLPVHPRYVLLGLSLGNEGIANVKTKDEKDAIFKQFETGMKGFITRSRENHIVPVVTSCYTRMDFTEVEYEYTRRMNLLINSWDVPSVNFLGAVDDGTGKWAKGFWYDSLHPNASGHEELTTTFVPTLFDALEKGKPAPAMSTPPGFVRASGAQAPITFTPGETMHPFALVLRARSQAEGAVAAVEGTTLEARTETKKIERGNRGAVGIEETTLSPGRPFSAVVGVTGGVWSYRAADGTTVASTVRADANWHTVVVSHYTARGETLFFVDGQLAGRSSERLQPKRFVIGGPGSAVHGLAPSSQVDLKDLMIYRSALNADEVAALRKGSMLQASLEVYAPLADARLATGTALENRAQSLSYATVEGAGLVHLDK